MRERVKEVKRVCALLLVCVFAYLASALHSVYFRFLPIDAPSL